MRSTRRAGLVAAADAGLCTDLFVGGEMYCASSARRIVCSYNDLDGGVLSSCGDEESQSGFATTGGLVAFALGRIVSKRQLSTSVWELVSKHFRYS